MVQETAKKIIELLKEYATSKKVAECNSKDDMYMVLSPMLPGVSKDTFIEAIDLIQTNQADIPDEDLEEVAGGVVKRLLKDTPD